MQRCSKAGPQAFVYSRPTRGAAASTHSRVHALLPAITALIQAGRLDDARAICLQLVRQEPRAAEPRTWLGTLAAQAGRYEEAVTWFEAAVALAPAQEQIRNNLGVALRRVGRIDDSIGHLQAAVGLRPSYAEAHVNLGNALRDAGRLEEARSAYRTAVGLMPPHAGTWNAIARVCLDLGRPDEALDAGLRATTLAPGDADTWLNFAGALGQCGRHEEALAALDRALALRPDDPAIHADRGNALMALQQHARAIEAFDRSLALAPLQPDVLEARADCALKAGQPDAAAEGFARLLAVAPDQPSAAGNLLHARMLGCDWRDHDATLAAIDTALREGQPAAEPFGYLGIATDEARARTCAELFSTREFPARAPLRTTRARPDAPRITIGYLCGEFRRHATTLLMCGAYEQHDRGRFRLVALDNGWSDGSDERARVEAAFDEIVPIRALSTDEAARRIAGLGVDILVNLNGYYGEHRMDVLARRSAPIQVSYLGFPGTLGAPYIDYVIADRVVLPEAAWPHFSESVVWLPDSYQMNDDRRAVAPSAGTRADHGLPAQGLVFACFNNSYKVTPATFSVWMGILRAVPGSVLWLLQPPGSGAARLRAEAAARGVDASRLVFATWAPPADHLARIAHADLCLDTLPYNAHTTASDALWAGVPFATCVGTTFPGRVGASLLGAMGLPELVASDPHAYERLVVQLALDPGRLAALRERIGALRRTSALFDTRRSTRHLEAAYQQMVDRLAAGQPPAPFAVAPA